MTGRLHPVLTVIFASLILIFTGGPVLLSLYGSLVPDRVMLDDSKSIFTECVSLETYRYVFTGELPSSYKHARLCKRCSLCVRQQRQDALSKLRLQAACGTGIDLPRPKILACPDNGGPAKMIRFPDV
jgi:hypothetical protein